MRTFLQIPNIDRNAVPALRKFCAVLGTITILLSTAVSLIMFCGLLFSNRKKKKKKAFGFYQPQRRLTITTAIIIIISRRINFSPPICDRPCPYIIFNAENYPRTSITIVLWQYQERIIILMFYISKLELRELTVGTHGNAVKQPGSEGWCLSLLHCRHTTPPHSHSTPWNRAVGWGHPPLPRPG